MKSIKTWFKEYCNVSDKSSTKKHIISVLISGYISINLSFLIFSRYYKTYSISITIAGIFGFIFYWLLLKQLLEEDWSKYKGNIQGIKRKITSYKSF